MGINRLHSLAWHLHEIGIPTDTHACGSFGYTGQPIWPKYPHACGAFGHMDCFGGYRLFQGAYEIKKEFSGTASKYFQNLSKHNKEFQKFKRSKPQGSPRAPKITQGTTPSANPKAMISYDFLKVLALGRGLATNMANRSCAVETCLGPGKQKRAVEKCLGPEKTKTRGRKIFWGPGTQPKPEDCFHN